MITQEECEELIINQYFQNESQRDNPSLLMNAWGENRGQCLSYFSNEDENMGPIAGLNKFLESLGQNQSQTHNSAIETGQATHNSATTTPYVPETQISSQAIHSTFYYIKLIVIAVILISFISKICKRCFRWGYAFMNHGRMIYMKVLLPRGDSKTDREQAKEIAKDMKEKIGRMSQVYTNLKKLGKLNWKDKIMYKFFRKPRISLMYHYTNGVLNFIVGCYPEYKTLIEGSIGAQYPDSSIELVNEPNIFKRKHFKVMPLQNERDDVYTLKLYKKLSDDPINNIIDAIGNISKYDTATIMLNIKPLGDDWNEQARKKIDRLYKNLDILPTGFGGKIWSGIKKFFKLMTTGEGPKGKSADDVTMVRMVKAQEDTLNDMGEEAGSPAFEAGLMLITSSDEKDRVQYNMENLIGAFSVYTDEYGNELEHLVNKASFLGFVSRPLWSLAASYGLTNLFFRSNVFTTGELTSLFHFPDYTYNRSNSIEWMQYKVVAAPSNLPTFSAENASDYIITGQLAEKYKGGDLSKILEEDKSHWAVGKKTITEEELVPINKFKETELEGKEIVEKDGEKFVKQQTQKDVYGYKIFNEGVLLGVNIYRNRYSPVYIKREDRTRHHYCIGKSGTGKSVFLQTLARQDMWNGDGLCVIDPHGDLVEDLLHYIPKERAKDVIFFDAGDEERPMGLNLYEINNIDEADRTVNDATEIFLKMFGPEIFGPRIQEYFKYGSLTILEDFEDRPTILDVTRLFTDEGYREYKTSLVKNPTVKNFREKTYNAMGDREKAEIIPYFSSKFVSFNTNRLIRNIIGQTRSAFNIEEVMNSGKILLISLSKGKIGDINAQLLGMILVSKIYNAAMARARMPEKDRKDFYLYVDEFQNFVSGTFADILSEARKYRLCLIMAHQYIAQLEAGQGLNKSEGGKGDVKSAVFGNVGTMMSFKVGAPDAEFLEKEYQPVLGAGDITGIANYKAYIKLNIDNATTRPFSMNAIYTKDYKNDKIVPILKEYSAKKYGRKREFVDAEIGARLGGTIQDDDIGGDNNQPANNESNQPATNETDGNMADQNGNENVQQEDQNTNE